MSEATHEQLCAACAWTDEYEQGENAVDKYGADCSCGCRWFHELSGERGMDWGVCFNPKSPLKGKLIFEHFGCHEFEYEEDNDE